MNPREAAKRRFFRLPQYVQEELLDAFVKKQQAEPHTPEDYFNALQFGAPQGGSE